MRPSQLLLVFLTLPAGGWAQSSKAPAAPSNPPPASSAAAAPPPATSAAAPPPSSAAKPPPETVNSPIAPPPTVASSAKVNPPQQTSAAVSPAPSVPNAPASSAPNVPASSAPNAPASSANPPAKPDSASGNGGRPTTTAAAQGTRAPPPSAPGTVQGTPQVGTGTAAPSAAPSAPGTRGQSDSPQASGSLGPNAPSSGGLGARPSLSLSLSSFTGGAGLATASPSSPNLATTASFSAQPSDSFRSVNDSSVQSMPESDEPTPPDISTIDHFHSELTVNIPDKAFTDSIAKKIAIMETAYFEFFVNNDPAPVDMGKIYIPANIVDCKNTWARRMVRRQEYMDEVLDLMPLSSRDLRGFDNCKAVETLEVGVYFHYMRATSTAERPNELESRVKAQVDALNESLGAVRITFRYMGLNWWEPKANENWTNVTRKESKLQDWQQRTRAPGKMVLTVWLVNGLRGNDNGDLNSYATFPNENLDPNDGIVIEESHVQGGDATTLIHDVGHWLGLGHTFVEIGEQCVVQDGLTNATATSGNRDVVYQCSQVPCSGGNAVDINNYMSYSSCRGKTPRDGFTTDQKARMFANALQFRRGYESGECMPDGKAAVKKRSSMQDLLDGKCPDYDKQASLLVNTPHSLAARMPCLSGKRWAAVAGVWAAVALFR